MRENLGQHFLTNAGVLRKIAEILEVRPEETVIEIGPGHGELTDRILASAGEAKIKLLLIERDPALAEALREKYAGKAAVREGDALDILPEAARGQKNYKLAGNIPYYLTGHLLRTISEMTDKPELTVFTIQKEVAERIVERPPHMNRLAAAVQVWAEAKIAGLISRRDFSPPPEVDSATVVLRRRTDAPAGVKLENYYAALHALFKQPRKTAENNLMEGLGIARADAQKLLRETGLRTGARPQDLDVGDIVRLGEKIRVLK